MIWMLLQFQVFSCPVREVDALIAAVVELADLTATAAPTIRTLCESMLLLNKTIEDSARRAANPTR
eukprot:631748-Amphidinium_carterae.1